MFSLFNTRPVKDKAHELANDLAKRLPPKSIDSNRQLLSVNKISNVLEKIYANALQYKQASRLGVFKRSVLANAFRWRLQELGYPQAFVDMAVEGLVVEISEIKRKKP